MHGAGWKGGEAEAPVAPGEGPGHCRPPQSAESAKPAMVGVALFESPYSLSWRYGVTGPVWSIDTTGDFVADYSIVMLNSNGFVTAGVQTAGGTYLCDAQVSWDGEARLYGASFPAACIGNPGVFVWRVGFLFEDFATGVDSFDAVPDLEQIGRDRVPVQGEVPSPINPPSGCTFHPRCPLAMDICKRDIPAFDGQVACHAAVDALEAG